MFPPGDLVIMFPPGELMKASEKYAFPTTKRSGSGHFELDLTAAINDLVGERFKTNRNRIAARRRSPSLAFGRCEIADWNEIYVAPRWS